MPLTFPLAFALVGLIITIIGIVGFKLGFFVKIPMPYPFKSQVVPWLTGEEKNPFGSGSFKSQIQKKYKKADKIYNLTFIFGGIFFAIVGIILNYFGYR